MERLPNVHPGDVLRVDFLEPLGITSYKLAKDIGVGQTRIPQILKRQRSVTLDTALRLARYFGTTPQLWLNIQMHYDLEELELKRAHVIEWIQPLARQQTNAPA